MISPRTLEVFFVAACEGRLWMRLLRRNAELNSIETRHAIAGIVFRSDLPQHSNVLLVLDRFRAGFPEGVDCGMVCCTDGHSFVAAGGIDAEPCTFASKTKQRTLIIHNVKEIALDSFQRGDSTEAF